jgi:hypothetical protein
MTRLSCAANRPKSAWRAFVARVLGLIGAEGVVAGGAAELRLLAVSAALDRDFSEREEDKSMMSLSWSILMMCLYGKKGVEEVIGEKKLLEGEKREEKAA